MCAFFIAGKEVSVYLNAFTCSMLAVKRNLKKTEQKTEHVSYFNPNASHIFTLYFAFRYYSSKPLKGNVTVTVKPLYGQDVSEVKETYQVCSWFSIC